MHFHNIIEHTETDLGNLNRKDWWKLCLHCIIVRLSNNC